MRCIILLMYLLKHIIILMVVTLILTIPARTQSVIYKNSIGIKVSGGYYNSFHLMDKDDYLEKGKAAFFSIGYSRLINENFQLVTGIRLIKTIDRLKSSCPFCDMFGEYVDISLISIPIIIRYHIVNGLCISAGFDYHVPSRFINVIVHSQDKLRSIDYFFRLGFDISISKEIRITDRLFISVEPQLILLTFSDYLFDDKYLCEENYAGLNLSIYRKLNFMKNPG
jgi:hypothetical protein